MTQDDLIAHYPRLWHMAEAGAWPAIRDRGLMSVAALLDDYGVVGARRDALIGTRRPAAVPLAAPGRPGATLRDQTPMTDARLHACLEGGLAPADWYRRLNGLVFFWPSRQRMWRLLGAKAYRRVPRHTVLTVSTARLLAARGADVRLSPINSGATLFVPQRRGPGTFWPIADFPFAERARTRPPADNVVELVVDGAVPDIAAHVLAVHEVTPDGVLTPLWRAPEAGPDDHP